MAEQPPLIAFPPVPHQPPDIHNAAKKRLIKVITDDGSISEEQAYLLEDSNDVEKAYMRWPRIGIPIPGRGSIVLASLLLRVQRNDGEIVFRQTPITVAIKELGRRLIDSKLRECSLGTRGPVNENPYNEIAVMQHHGDDEHILECYEALSDEDCLYIVTLYAQEGDLGDNITWILDEWGLGGGYTLPNRVPQVAEQLAENLQYLENRDLVHRDLKPQNIVKRASRFPFIDCAMALQIARVDGNLQLIAKQGNAGTESYKSPEVFRRQAFNHKADVWAYGSILFNLLTGLRFCEMPSDVNLVYNFFITQGGLQDEDLCERRLQELLNNGGGNSHLGRCIQAVQVLNPVARELLTLILKPNPRDRPDMDAILTHPFFDNVP